MKIYSEVIGNVYTDTNWAKKLKETEIEYLDLDQWTAQKSRFIVKSSAGAECAVALRRHSRIENGDIMEYDAQNNTAVVIRIDLKPVLVVDLQKIASLAPDEIIRRSVELGHAVGNQHWPAIVKGTKVYIPLTVDKKVMMSVMETHHFEDMPCEFQEGREVLPFLSPHEVRKLFGGSSQELPYSHVHHH
ncbi:MAG: hypothetical protein NC131_15870 [Roseburia sp.]|nr:hypothetical protein [Roseburia sp.]